MFNLKKKAQSIHTAIMEIEDFIVKMIDQMTEDYLANGEKLTGDKTIFNSISGEEIVTEKRYRQSVLNFINSIGGKISVGTKTKSQLILDLKLIRMEKEFLMISHESPEKIAMEWRILDSKEKAVFEEVKHMVSASIAYLDEDDRWTRWLLPVF